MKFLRVILAGLIVSPWFTTAAYAGLLSLSDSPMFASSSAPPLTLMVMGRDHKLYYEAYNDASDLDGDGTLDIGYKPASIDYYGYFGSYVCYIYDSTDGRFEPSAATTTKKCSGATEWSGDFLNYLTTARIDALRKVFYGGTRSTDTSSLTVLERTFIPQDGHSWGKEYESVANDGYDISEYTPLALPASGARHLFANVTLSVGGDPLLRVLNDSQYRIWNWVSIERPVAGSDCVNSGGSRVTCATSASTWSIVPKSNGASGAGLKDLTMSTYDITGSSVRWPNNQAEFDTMVLTYANATYQFGSSTVQEVNGTGNRWGANDYYMTLFTGTLVIPTGEGGTYTFAVDGDDAVDVFIDGAQVAGWYGGHGNCNCQTYSGSVTLSAGEHTLLFRHQDWEGGDNYFLYWDKALPASSMTDYIVRNQVCASASLKEANCQLYSSGNYKPVGLLQDYGENDSMMFGLLTGSYEKNTSGGVLRKNIGTFTDEIDLSTGQFSSTSGIVGTIDKLKIVGFLYGSGNYYYNDNCGWITGGPISEGQCRMWGNPVAEMMYEGLRYFAGKSGPTSAFDIASSGNDDATLGLPKPAWTDPYDTASQCAKPFEIVISDVNPSFDTDQLPGVDSDFGSFSGDLTGLNVSALADTITTTEGDIAGSRFIGQVDTLYDGAPTAKTVTSLGSIRGLAPEEPTKQGGYYSASVAYYGKKTDISSTASDDQFVDTFSVAVASPLPRIAIPVNGSTITVVPFAKSVGWPPSGISPVQGDFQPTNTIVDFYIDTLTATSGSFRINYEDVEQGADHDMDAIVEYEYTVNADNTVTINLTSTYAAGGIIQHMGYVISGTTADGIYLEVRDYDTGSGSDPDYFLDTPPGQAPGGVWNDSADLPLNASRTFTPSGSGTSASILKNPLWYAAKWGGYQEGDNPNDLPDQTAEWDEDGDGDPDNYFLVTNALDLKTQLSSAFNEILARSGSASAAALSSGEISSTTALYESVFNTGNWTGELSSYSINSTPPVGANDPPIGAIADTPTWTASSQVPAQASRVIITHDGATNDGSNGGPFLWTSLTSVQQALLNKDINGSTDTNGSNRLNYLRGDQTLEGPGQFRVRSTLLGDLVNSNPIYVGSPDFFYPDNWGSGEPETSVPYSTNFYDTARTPVVYVGGNDGMMHGFNADTGAEVLAYVPNALYPNLSALTAPTYTHRFYADGSAVVVDAFFDASGNNDWHTVLVAGLNKGGQAVYALDVTDPASFTASDTGLVLWEFSDADDADLGYTYGEPAVARMNNGDWVAIFGNGYNNTAIDTNISSSGDAVLFIVDLQTGVLLKKISTEQGVAEDPSGNSRPNGLASVAPIDTNGDYIIDYIYAGDLFGNMWVFDVTSSNTNQWDVRYSSGNTPAPLYVAQNGSSQYQPITTAPDVGVSPLGSGVIVYFGTGKYIENTDKATSELQTFYGVIDNGAKVTGGRSDLQVQSVLTTVNSTCVDLEGNSATCSFRITTDTALDVTSDEGWYMDLPDSGERVVSAPLLRGDRIIFVTLVPEANLCSGDGTGWLMELDARDGSRLTMSPFDLNGDSMFTDADFVTYTYTDANGDEVTIYVPVSGKKFADGAPAGTPGVLKDTENDKEFKYTQLSNGQKDTIVENPDDMSSGRQSWQQVR